MELKKEKQKVQEKKTNRNSKEYAKGKYGY